MATVTEHDVVLHSFSTQVDIPEKQRTALIALLNRRLADASDLKTQTKYAHWNVKGMNFIALHELFDEIAGHVEEHIDLIAERVTALGGVAHGTARQAVAGSGLGEYNLGAVSGEEHVAALSGQLAKFGNAVREGIDAADAQKDKATSDLLTEIVRQVDKDLWFLEAHLQR